MQPNNRPLILGLTGGIASGKSLACEWFSQMGIPVVSADTLGHRLLEDSDVIKWLAGRFGENIVTDGRVNRPKLGQIVFKNPELLAELNNHLHPLIRREQQTRTDACKGPIIIHEVPLLFEAGMQACFDGIILILAPVDIRIKRLIDRGFSQKEAELRIARQMPDPQKIPYSDWVFENANTREHLFETLEKHLPNIVGHPRNKNLVRFDNFHG